jgi:two-component system heavy metal sensor histidine kinase CusS
MLRDSITFRLTAIYTLTTFGLLALTTLFLYWIFVNQLYLGNEHFLKNKALILQGLLRSQSTQIAQSTSYQEEMRVEPLLEHFFSRIVDKQGKVIIETPGMSEVAPTSSFATIFPQGEATLKVKHKKPGEEHRRYYLLLTLPANPELPIGDNMYYLQMAKDISKEHEIIEEIRESLFVILLCGIVVAAIVSAFVTYRNLQPLKKITRSTQSITITHLKERLNPASWPSELSSLATAFNRMLDRIEEGFIRLSQFAADLAHELRTPINNLMGEAEITLSRSRTAEEYRDALESSLEELQRISQMIESLLFIARAENPQQTIVYSRVELPQLLQSICDFYEAAAEEKRVTLQYRAEGNVVAEPRLLRRAITNLVSNALQHCAAGDVITLLTLKNAGGSTQINVNDTGKGIAAEHLPHLFDRFYRVDSDRSQHTGGTGLGLAIVKSIMDLHHGSVDITSQPGKGTTVSLIFFSSLETL